MNIRPLILKKTFACALIALGGLIIQSANAAFVMSIDDLNDGADAIQIIDSNAS